MNRKKRIQFILSKYFKKINIEIIDNSIYHAGHNSFNGEGETHLLIKIKNKFEKTTTRLQIHRQINLLLKEEFDNGLHALEIKIYD